MTGNSSLAEQTWSQSSPSLLAIAAIVAAYVVSAELVKRWFCHRYGV
jgi:hypothetical protein